MNSTPITIGAGYVALAQLRDRAHCSMQAEACEFESALFLSHSQ